MSQFSSGGQRIVVSALATSNEGSVLISFRNDWFDLLAVYRTPTPQFKSLNSLVLQLLYGSALIPVHDCWKNIALTIWTFVGKVMSLLFNALARCVIAFLPRSKCLLMSWLQSMSTVILEPKKMKSDSFHFFLPCICHEVIGLDAMIFIFFFLNVDFKSAFSLSSYTLINWLFSSSSLL